MMGSIIKLTRWSLQSEVHIYFFDTGCETFFGTKFFRDRFRDFFRYQIFSRPVPGLFSVPNFFETGSETFFGTKFFRDRFRYHQKNWRIPGNGNSRDRDVTLCPPTHQVGTAFLWVFWPSFNTGAAAEGDAQMRALINTYLALCASCMAAFAISALVNPQVRENGTG